MNWKLPSLLSLAIAAVLVVGCSPDSSLATLEAYSDGSYGGAAFLQLNGRSWYTVSVPEAGITERGNTPHAAVKTFSWPNLFAGRTYTVVVNVGTPDNTEYQTLSATFTTDGLSPPPYEPQVVKFSSCTVAVQELPDAAVIYSCLLTAPARLQLSYVAEQGAAETIMGSTGNKVTKWTVKLPWPESPWTRWRVEALDDAGRSLAEWNDELVLQ